MPDAALLADACGGFHSRFPARSARHVISWGQVVGFSILATLIGFAFHHFSAASWTALHGLAFSLFFLAILIRLIAAAQLRPILSRLPAPRAAWPTYTLLCPLYREANVVADLAAALDKLDYPRAALDIQFLVEADDDDTITAALAAKSGDHIRVVAVPAARPRTKPKALNVGLALARGQYLAVYDAEDRPHPLQLRAAIAAFEDRDRRLACVQAPLVVDNANASWIASQFAAEYAIQFREILPLLARWRLPLPLGGSSNHFRIEALREAGGWDADNVTEDADLGYRLARDGWTSDVIAPPTWEEAPISFGAWFNQRTRWIKGHLHTWLVLMRDPITTMREMGLRAFATMQLVLLGGVLAALLHGPLAAILLLSVLTPLELLSTADIILALCGYCVAVFAALTASALANDLGPMRAAPTMPLYWPLASLAAYRAVFELILRPHHWSKTTHGLSRRTKMSFKSAKPAAIIDTPEKQRA